MLRVRRSGPRLAFSGPWSGGLAPLHPASVASGDDGVLAGRAFTGFSQAPLARPTGPKPRTTAGFNEILYDLKIFNGSRVTKCPTAFHPKGKM